MEAALILPVPADDHVGLIQVAQAMRLVSEVLSRMRDNEGAVRMMMIRLAVNQKLSPDELRSVLITSLLEGDPTVRTELEAQFGEAEVRDFLAQQRQMYPKADQDLTRRLLAVLQRNPDNDLVIGNPGFKGDRGPLLAAAPELATRIRDDLGAGADDAFIFNHIKSFTVGEWLMMLTSSLHPNDKLDVAVHVRDPELVGHFNEWLRLVGQPASVENLARRRELVMAMGQRGYQVNDPLARTYNAASAINGLIFDVGPGGRVVMFVKELQDMTIARGLVEQARRGVTIEFTLYDIDPSIARYLSTVLAAEPELPLTIHRGKNSPKFHGNFVYAESADGRSQAFVGSNYLWFNQNVPSSPSGVSYEAGMLLQGVHARRLLDQVLGARQEHGLSGELLVGARPLLNRAGEPRTVAQLAELGIDTRTLSDLTALRSLLTALKENPASYERHTLETEIAHLMQRAGLTGPDAHDRFALLHRELGDGTIGTRELDALLWRSALVSGSDSAAERAARVVQLSSRLDPAELDADALRSLIRFSDEQSGTGATGRRVLNEIAGLPASEVQARLRQWVESGVLSEPIRLVDRNGRELEVWVARDGTVIRGFAADANTSETTFSVGVLKQNRTNFSDAYDLAFELAADGRLQPVRDRDASSDDSWRSVGREQRRYLMRLLLGRRGTEPLP